MQSNKEIKLKISLDSSTNIHRKNSNSSTSSTGSLSSKTTKWISQFCSANQFLAKVDTNYIMDSFNLIGLEEKVYNYHKALAIILDRIDSTMNFTDSTDSDSTNDDVQHLQLLSSAEVLYGLIHARYILTEIGLQQMSIKYEKRLFGSCIRYYCEQAAMLPVGLSDQLNKESVRLYCPRCKDIYVPQFSKCSMAKFTPLDGAYFGTSFPHMFFMVFPYYRPPPLTKSFVPTLFGYKIHESAYQYQAAKAEEAERAKKPIFKTVKIPTVNNNTNHNSTYNLEFQPVTSSTVNSATTKIR